MLSFYQHARCSFSGAAATVALTAAFSGSAPAQTAPIIPAAKLPNACMAFEGNTARREQKYDKPFGMLVEQLKSWSGWPALRAQMKAANAPFDGLCASTQAPGAVVPMPQFRSFAVNITDPATRQAVDPAKFVNMIEADTFRMAAGLVSLAGTLSLNTADNPLITTDQDLHTMIILRTALTANGLADSIMLAAEAAAENNRTADLNTLYAKMPQQVAEINDFHALALIAKDENRDLTDAERNKFRNTLFTIMLKDPDTHNNLAQEIGNAIANVIAHKMMAEAVAGKQPTAATFKPFNTQTLIEKLSRFPGNMAANEMVAGYKAYWQANAEKDQTLVVEKILESVPARVMERIRKGAAAGHGLKPQ